LILLHVVVASIATYLTNILPFFRDFVEHPFIIVFTLIVVLCACSTSSAHRVKHE
jgi:hypothetical protein